MFFNLDNIKQKFTGIDSVKLKEEVKNLFDSLSIDKSTVQLLCHAKSKRLKIRINPSSEQPLVLVYPSYGFSNEEIIFFLRSQELWIKKQLNSLEDLVNLYDQKNISLLGVEHSLKVLDAKDFGYKGVKNKNNTLKMKQNYIEDLLKNTLDTMIAENKDLLLARLGFKQESASLRFNVSKRIKNWGICRKKNRNNYTITLNIRLALAPRSVAVYVLAHEIAHIKEMNHSSDFWQLVDKIWPGYSNDKNWLKVNGVKLQKYILN